MRALKNTLLIVIALGLAGAVATYVRYRSFSPCDWIQHDLAEETALPRIVVQSRIHADFLLQGITDPTPAQCLRTWWKFRRIGELEALPPGSRN